MNSGRLLIVLLIAIFISILPSFAEVIPSFSDSDLDKYKKSSDVSNNHLRSDWSVTISRCGSVQSAFDLELSQLLGTVKYILETDRNAPTSIKKCKNDIEAEILNRKQKMESSAKRPSSSTSTYSPSDETRKKLEKDEIRRKRDALQPILEQGCLQGNNEACRQYKEWESLRKY